LRFLRQILRQEKPVDEALICAFRASVWVSRMRQEVPNPGQFEPSHPEQPSRYPPRLRPVSESVQASDVPVQTPADVPQQRRQRQIVRVRIVPQEIQIQIQSAGAHEGPTFEHRECKVHMRYLL
jgi:hypothetical protein